MKKPFDNRKREVVTAGEAIQELLGTYHISSKFNQTEVKASWERLMGSTIASRTGKLFFKKNVLFVEISSAALKQELNMNKSKMLAILQNEFGRAMVEEIVFL